MPHDPITVETRVAATPATAWIAYTAPDHVMRWNFASDDWHCPAARADLREGGQFSARMEARDGSMGFDFEGTYTKVMQNARIDYTFGDRRATVEFLPEGPHTRVRVTFEPEAIHPVAMQRDGWQAILDNDARHVAGL